MNIDHVTPGKPDELAELQAELLADFDRATCPTDKLAQMQIPPREAIVGSWLREGVRREAEWHDHR